mgnify:CR=1 FL=1
MSKSPARAHLQAKLAVIANEQASEGGRLAPRSTASQLVT